MYIYFSIVAILAASGAALAHGDEAHTLRFTNGLWWNGQRFEARTVVVADGVIAADARVEIERTIDLDGRYVVPPLADAHRHQFLGPDAAKESDAALRLGIFYVKNPHGIAPMARHAAAEVNRPSRVDVTYSLAGLTSSGGHPTQLFRAQGGESLDGVAYFEIDDRATLDTRWDAIVATGTDWIKVYLEHSERHAARREDPAFGGKRGLDPRLVETIVARAHAEGLRVTAHVATAADFRAAVAAGVDELAHLPLEAIERDDATRAAKAGVTVVTTLLSHREGGHGEAVEQIHRTNLAHLRAAGVRLVVGTDNNSVTVVDELQALARLGDVPAPELFRIATETTPRWVFPDRKLSCLDAGCEASFVVTDGDPREDLARYAEATLRVKQGRVLALEAAGTPSIAEAMMPLLQHGDVPGAIARYRELRTSEPDAWNFDEQELNGLGYGVMQHGHPGAAVPVFELNVEMFPDSANAYDSLADACEAAGNTARAREALARVLELLELHDRPRGSTRYTPEFRDQLIESAHTRLTALGAADDEKP